MTVNEFWARIAISAALFVTGLVLATSGSHVGAVLLVLGIAGAVWTAIWAKTQIRRMDRAVVEKRARQSSSS